MNYFLDVVKNHYADFEGRMDRKSYWMFILFYILIAIGVGIVAGILMSLGSVGQILGGLVYGVFGLGMIVPSLAAVVRRLRDAGYHWACIFLSLIPAVGSIIVIVLLCMPSKVDGQPASFASTMNSIKTAANKGDEKTAE